MKNVARSLPLFETAKRQALKTLCVRRFEGGRWVRAPQSFDGGDLPNRDAIRGRFGGGRYEVIGRDGQKIVARTRFIVEGPPRPLDESPPGAPSSRERAFATATGEREALVFALLDDGLDVVDITRRTGIDARTVRAIFDEWITPLGTRDTIDARRSELANVRRANLETDFERELLR